ncbi:hypothetical protein ACIBCA_02050 [Kitasatospora sp. NPDC051170]|uniref:hypothetical protein n=1 Tax=Kitasatospora sp. NPDC051170 TaxID=3364056 RepID=UPI0037B303F6
MDIVRDLGAALGCGDGAATDIGPGHHRLATPELTVDVLGDARTAHRVVHLLPGGGLNVAAAYCTAQGRSLARFLADHGYLVIGTTPREDALTPDLIGPHCADWGLDGHRTDLGRVLDAATAVTGLPYELLGHSAGAALALATAAARGEDAGLRRVLVLDTTGPYDPRTHPELAAKADALTDHFLHQLASGVTTVDPGLKALLTRAATAPDSPSALPRPAGRTGRFTNLGLLHYALTHTRDLPGPVNWIYHRAQSSGTHTFGPTPAEDHFTLDHTPFPVWRQAIARLGSGLQPTALLRDLAAIWAQRTDVHHIDWPAVRADVVWLNTELGRGDHDFGARLIRTGGASVDYRVVPGYGHGDIVWSATAERDVWRYLLPE